MSDRVTAGPLLAGSCLERMKVSTEVAELLSSLGIIMLHDRIEYRSTLTSVEQMSKVSYVHEWQLEARLVIPC